MISGAEAGRIGRALESVAGWTSEIIVVLNDDVSDGTEEVTRRFGAKVFREPWKGHVAQKNSAAAKATQPWLLGLDADEAVSEALRAEIARTLSTPAGHDGVAAFSFPRCAQFCGRWIRHGDWYPDRGVRLWRNGQATWGGEDPHDKLQVTGRVGRLRADLLHFTAMDLNHQILKSVKYADLFVQQQLIRGEPAGGLDLWVRPGWRFLRGYVLRLGFLDGWQGLAVARLCAFQTFLRHTRLREEQTKARSSQ
jgi:glycosyltransferase involved in cell wall biosynthesis